MSREHNAQIMRTYLQEVCGNGRLELIDDLAAEDMVDEAALSVGGPTGRAGLVFHVELFFKSLGDTKIEIKRIVAEDDQVMAWWTADGIHQEEWLGVPASHERILSHACSFFTIRDGKISRYSLLAVIGFPTPIMFDSTLAGV